jgi:HAD superfamily hydrolase (TIGR01509 family)
VAIRAIFFDLGGVLVRTEFEAPRQHLAERLNIEYEDIVRLVFESETSRMASLGRLSVDEHWAAIAKKLGRPASEAQALHSEFFAGDVLDRRLISFIRSVRPEYRTGLISNAWGDLRAYLVKEKGEDAFDTLTISAEVGLLKPEAAIFRLALETAQVQAEEALFVDDTVANIAGCEAVGMRGILFRDPEETIQAIEALM